MVPEEFYIRGASETEARGPFNAEQVASLAEAGQVTPETLYYEAATEDWVAIAANPEVNAVVFPVRQKLEVRQEVEVSSLNEDEDSTPPITVSDMLAAAEGRTADTRDKADRSIAMARAAKMGLWAATIGLALAAVAELLPSIDALTSFDVAALVGAPVALLGLLDVVLTLLLALGMTALYPFIRFRAAFGIGFLGLVYWTQGASTQFTVVAVGSAGLYLTTVFLSYVPVSVAALMTIAGMGGMAWFALNS